MRMYLLLATAVLALTACAGDLPCSELDEAACLADELCLAEYLESCGCSCADETCGDACCEFDRCVEAE